MCPPSDSCSSCFAWSSCWATSLAGGQLLLQLRICQRTALKRRENARFLPCNAASGKEMTFLKTSSLLLDQHVHSCFLPCLLPLCAASNWVWISGFKPVANSSLASSQSPLHQHAQRCPSAGKWNNVDKRCSATFSALFCSGLGMWRYQMGPRICLYSGPLLSTLLFAEHCAQLFYALSSASYL